MVQFDRLKISNSQNEIAVLPTPTRLRLSIITHPSLQFNQQLSVYILLKISMNSIQYILLRIPTNIIQYILLKILQTDYKLQHSQNQTCLEWTPYVQDPIAYKEFI